MTRNDGAGGKRCKNSWLAYFAGCDDLSFTMHPEECGIDGQPRWSERQADIAYVNAESVPALLVDDCIAKASFLA